MRKILLTGFLLIVFFATGCELETRSYNNPYSKDWYRMTATTGETFDVTKLVLSDTNFESFTTTYDADLNNTGYIGKEKGNISYISSSVFVLEITQFNLDWSNGGNRWVDRSGFIEHFVSLNQTESDAITAANNTFTTATVGYSLGADPLRIFFTNADDYTGTYYSNAAAAIIYRN